MCLCNYDSDDVLIRLPCEHLFHEDCVARWLSQDSSCPQCRFNLRGPAAPPPRHLRVAPAAAPVDEEAGTELAGRPLGNDAAASTATEPTAAEPQAAEGRQGGIIA